MEIFKLVGSIVVDDSQAKKSIKGVKDEVDSVPGFFQKAGGAVGGFMGKVGKIAGAVGVFKLVDGAVNMITNSFDGAISRVDTLKQFPKVLEMMGVEGEDAEASIARLSEGIQGLPTPLDEIASSTQRMFTIFGDIDLATESTLALNNAFLASGASQEDANRGMEQYMQMLSTGKVDMQSWRTLQETMPYALQETAEAFGFTGESAQNDFYDALLAGDITMEEFNAKVIELSEGQGGFAEMALEGSRGIATSWQNIQTAITSGVANIITAFDDWLESNGFGGIPEVLDRIKEKVGVAFSAIAEWVPIALDWMRNLFNTIKESTAFEILKTVVMELFGFITETVPAVIGAMWELFNTVLESTAFQSLFDIITSIFDAITESTAFQSLIDLLIWVYEAGIDFVGVLGDMGIIETVVGWVGDLVDVFLELDFREIASALGELVDKWSPLIAGVMGAYGAYKLIINATTIWNGIVAIATGITGALSGAYTFLTTTLTLANLKTVVMTVATGAWNIVAGIATTVTTALAGAIAFLTSPIGIAVVAIGAIIAVGVLLYKNWDTVKEKAGQLGAKISEIWNNIKTATSDAWNSVKETISGAVSGAWDAVVTQFTNIVNSISEKMTSAVNAVKDIGGGIKGFFDGINLFESGKAIIQSAIDGLVSMKDKLTGKVKDIVGSVRDFFPFSPAKEGPLSDIDKMDFGGPISDSIENAEGPINRAMQRLAGVARNGLMFDAFVKTGVDSNLGVLNGEVSRSGYSFDSTLGSSTRNQMAGGNKEVNQTITINSPRPLDPIESARQIKKASRQLALEH